MGHLVHFTMAIGRKKMCKPNLHIEEKTTPPRHPTPPPKKNKIKKPLWIINITDSLILNKVQFYSLSILAVHCIPSALILVSVAV